MRLTLAALALASCGPPQPQPAPPPPASACAHIADALRACTPAVCEEPHAFVPGAMTSYEIVGEQGGACVYAETIAGDQMLMRCRLSETERRAYADALVRFWQGEISAGSELRLDCDYLDR